MASPDNTVHGEAKPFIEHLNDLRTVIIHSGLLLAAGIILMIPFTPLVLKLTMMPLSVIGVDYREFLVSLSVGSGFAVAIKISLWGGLLLSAPFIVLVVGRFVFPALTAGEKHAVSQSGGYAVVLFFLGVAVCYFTTLPFALRAMIGINDWLGLKCDFINVRDYVAFVIRLLLAFGLAFELPVVVLAMSAMGVVNSRQLKNKRPYVWVALMAAAMFLTPPDPITQLLLAGPLALLYEFCIWTIARREKKRDKASLR